MNSRSSTVRVDVIDRPNARAALLRIDFYEIFDDDLAMG